MAGGVVNNLLNWKLVNV